MLWWKVRFSPCHGEKSDLHHAVVKSQIFTMPWGKVRFTPHHGEKSDFHHAMVKSQIYTTFSPHCGQKSDLHHAVVKSQIYTTFSPHMLEFSWQNLHHNVVKIDFHYKIYTTCGENSFIYTTCGENCQSNVVVTFSVISKIGPTFLMFQLQLKIFQYVVKIILPYHLVLKK